MIADGIVPRDCCAAMASVTIGSPRWSFSSIWSTSSPITQLSHLLLEHLDVRGALQTGLLLLAVWWAWIYTAWTTNWFDPNQRPVRLMLIGVMAASLIVSAVLPEAFGERGADLCRGLRGDAGRAHALRGRTVLAITRICTATFSASWPGWSSPECSGLPVGWRAGRRASVLVGRRGGGRPDSLRRQDSSLPAWAARPRTTGTSAASTWPSAASSSSSSRSGSRSWSPAATFGELEFTSVTLAAFVVAFLGSVALWWVYFDRSSEAAERGHSLIETILGRLGRFAYTYLHIPMVAGIIVTAVGDELAIAHPFGSRQPGNRGHGARRASAVPGRARCSSSGRCSASGLSLALVAIVLLASSRVVGRDLAPLALAIVARW